MPSGRVLEPNHIYLDGNQYRVASIVEKASSVLPEKQTFGDYTKTSDPTKSQVVFADWTGGIGQWYLDTAEPKRAYYSTAQLRHKGHLIPPFASANTNDLATPNTSAIGFLIASDVTQAGTGTIWCAFGDVIYHLEADNGNWGNAVLNIAGSQTVTDAVTGDLGGTVYLVVAHTGGYVYTSDGAAWTQDTTQAVRYLAFWDEKLWMISTTGQLYYCWTIGTENADAKLRQEQETVTDLFVGPDASGEPILYVATTTGLYAHDFASTRLIKTGLVVPDNANNGQGCCVWRGNIYYPSNMGVYEYSPVTGLVRAMGLDMDDGVQAANNGYIKRLEPSLYELIAIVDCSGVTSGKTAIYGWDGAAWECKYEEPGGNAWNADYLHVSSAYLYGTTHKSRIWYAAGIGGGTPDRKVRYIEVPSSRIHPAQLGTLFSFATTSSTYTPWFTAGQDNVDKIALAVKLDADIPTNTTIALYYERDWDESAWTTIDAAISTEPTVGGRVLTYAFPATGDAVGRAFRSIRFDVVLAGTASAFPTLRSLTLEYVTKLRVKRKWQVVIDMNQIVNGKSPAQQRDNLLTALGAQTLVEFTYRNEAGYFVLVNQDETSIITGFNEQGTMALTLVEP